MLQLSVGGTQGRTLTCLASMVQLPVAAQQSELGAHSKAHPHLTTHNFSASSPAGLAGLLSSPGPIGAGTAGTLALFHVASGAPGG